MKGLLANGYRSLECICRSLIAYVDLVSFGGEEGMRGDLGSGTLDFNSYLVGERGKRGSLGSGTLDFTSYVEGERSKGGSLGIWWVSPPIPGFPLLFRGFGDWL